MPRAVTLPQRDHLDRIAAPGFDPSALALVEHDLPRDFVPGPSARVLDVTIVSGDEQRVSIAAPDGGLLVLSERYHPGWSALADGRPVEVQRADYVLMAIAVPPGTRTVMLEFRMPWLRASWTISGLAVSAALALLLRDRLKRQ